MESTKPFPEALQALLDERSWSQRQLSRKLRDELGHKEGISHSSLRLYMTGDLQPTRSAMERIAKVCRIDPDYFAERRLEVVRDALNWRVLGTEAALAALADLAPARAARARSV